MNDKQSVFSAKLDISATNWDLKYGRVLSKNREARGTNSKLDKTRSGIMHRARTTRKNSLLNKWRKEEREKIIKDYI